MAATLQDKTKTGRRPRRYLSRVGKQRVELHQAVERLAAGHLHGVGDVYDLTYQIKETAGAFGYQRIATAAAAIHDFVLNVDPDRLADQVPELTGLMVDFDLALTDALGGHTGRRGPPSRIKHLPVP